jgi:hypothetical protein
MSAPRRSRGGFLPPLSPDDLANRFGYHRPTDDHVTRHEKARSGCHELAQHLVQLVPPGRELSLALTALEEVAMWANAGIARQE